MLAGKGDFWSGRRCLVTGGFGFGGSHLAEQLMRRGARIYVLDRVRPRNSYLVLMGLDGKVEYIPGDVRDTELVKWSVERHEIQNVFHLAAQPIVPMSNLYPYETASVNIMGTYSVLEAVRTSPRAPALVLASSGAYYGTTSQQEPISEDAPPLIAGNIYAPSKVGADIAVRCYARTYGIRAAVCRFINTYGPGNTNFSTIIPRTMSILMNGQDYDFGARDDGASTFDYLHITDMTRGYILVAENIERVCGEAFNFGGERCISVRDLVTLISRTFDGKEREAVFHGAKKPVPVYKCLDTAKSQRVLGWQPTVSLEAGLKETIEWYRSFWSKL